MLKLSKWIISPWRPWNSNLVSSLSFSSSSTIFKIATKVLGGIFVSLFKTTGGVVNFACLFLYWSCPFGFLWSFLLDFYWFLRLESYFSLRRSVLFSDILDFFWTWSTFSSFKFLVELFCFLLPPNQKNLVFLNTFSLICWLFSSPVK